MKRTQRTTRPVRPAARCFAFTLLELLVVLAIMIFMAGTMLLSFDMMQASAAVESAGSTIANLFWIANQRAIEKKVPHMVVINRGDKTVRLISAGRDKRFAMVEDLSQSEEVRDFARDDVPDSNKVANLNEISRNVVILRALGNGGIDPDLALPASVQEELSSAVFVFTHKGVKYGMANLESDGKTLQVIQISDALPTTTDLYVANTQADIVLTDQSSNTIFFMNLDSITGRAYSKVVARSDIPLLDNSNE